MVLHKLGITVHFPHPVGDNNPGILPSGIARPDDTGRDIGIRALGSLTVLHIRQPLGEKRGGISMEHRGLGKDLGIGGPAGSFVTLRAVGGDIERISTKAPIDILDEFIQERIIAGKCQGRRQVRVEDNCRPRIWDRARRPHR